MEAAFFLKQLQELNIDTIAGVPDSALKGFCNYINAGNDSSFRHFVPANEGAAVGIAIGSYLSSGKPACVYMQNSGLGNAVNPITSLANEKVYGIPMLLLIGWRGQPDKKDEPQHKFMGAVTLPMLKVLDISYDVIFPETTERELLEMMKRAGEELGRNRQYAIVAAPGAFKEEAALQYQNSHSVIREDAIREILKSLGINDIVVSTTGKISREVYEQSNMLFGGHSECFMTVGGMGHASMIAFGIAVNKPDRRVICIEGDGALMMHMGSLSFLGNQKPENFLHICLNNEAHESVGGMPTGAAPDYWKAAKEAGYDFYKVVKNYEELKTVFPQVLEKKGMAFVEIKVAMDSRKDLGRPVETAQENKIEFMEYIAKNNKTGI